MAGHGGQAGQTGQIHPVQSKTSAQTLILFLKLLNCEGNAFLNYIT